MRVVPAPCYPTQELATSSDNLSPGEFELLKVLWGCEGGTVAQVRSACERSDGSLPAYTTVMTVLGRLVDKGAARVDKDKQPFRYRSTYRRPTILRQRLRDFLQHSYDGDAELLIEHLLRDAQVDREALRQRLSDSELP